MNSKPPPAKSRKAHCNTCLRETNHEVLFAETKAWSETVDEEYGVEIYGSDTYSLLRCAGCEEVRFIHEHSFSEDDDEGRPVQHRDYYPPSVNRQKPNWVMLGLPIRLGLYAFGELLDEIYRALAVNALRLAAMGIRALVEQMMIDKVGDQGSFDRNITAFFAGGYVAGIQQEVFRNTLIEAGHAAMHREWQPSLEDINTLLDIVEGIIKAIYVDSAAAKRVGDRIPPRVGKFGQGNEPQA